MGDRILVTGGTGFIGTNLCLRLLQENNYVICLDNLYSGQKNNIELLKKFDNFKFVEHDVRDEFYYDVDYIYNLACPASPKFYQKNGIYTINTNVRGIINSLEVAKKMGQKYCKRVQVKYMGMLRSIHRRRHIGGNVNPYGPRACFDEGKRNSREYYV